MLVCVGVWCGLVGAGVLCSVHPKRLRVVVCAPYTTECEAQLQTLNSIPYMFSPVVVHPTQLRVRHNSKKKKKKGLGTTLGSVFPPNLRLAEVFPL